MLRKLLITTIALFVISPVMADESDELIAQMRQEIETLKAQVEVLTRRVEQISPAAQKKPETSTVVIPEPPEPDPVVLTPPQASSRVNRSFNPAISAVFQAIGAYSLDHDIEEEGFSLSEAEVGFQAVVDTYARVDLFLAFSADGEAEVEEGIVSTLGLAGGLQVKGGRFKNTWGKWNLLHDHRYYTVEQPDVLTNFFGDEGLRTDGLSLSWLIPGTKSVFVESVSQAGSVLNDVSFSGESSDFFFNQHLNAVFPLTGNQTLGVGGSAAIGTAGPTDELIEAIDMAGLAGMISPSDDLDSDVYGVDLTWKWKPLQRGLYRSAFLQAEGLLNNREIENLDLPSQTLNSDTVRSKGGYLYGEYQWAKRWRGGLRYDFSEFPGNESAKQRGYAAVLRIIPTEFQEFRIQFKHVSRNDQAALMFHGIEDDNQIFIEWIPVIGTHPAHAY